jgi:NAD(P)-dependent dehydrogenase (short-subunit alcohol dehydrogenase family)
MYSITEGPVSQWRSVVDLNLLGLSICTKEALQSMKERGVDDGHIIHISRCSNFATVITDNEICNSNFNKDCL